MHFVLGLVEVDHHELLRPLNHFRIVEYARVILAVRTGLRENHQADRLLLLLRLGQTGLIGLPGDAALVPIMGHGDSGESQQPGQEKAAGPDTTHGKLVSAPRPRVNESGSTPQGPHPRLRSATESPSIELCGGGGTSDYGS